MVGYLYFSQAQDLDFVPDSLEWNWTCGNFSHHLSVCVLEWNWTSCHRSVSEERNSWTPTSNKWKELTAKGQKRPFHTSHYHHRREEEEVPHLEVGHHDRSYHSFRISMSQKRPPAPPLCTICIRSSIVSIDNIAGMSFSSGENRGIEE